MSRRPGSLPPGWLWFCLAGALLIPGRPLYALLYLLGGVWLLAYLSLTWGMRRLEVERVVADDRLFAGESLPVLIRFRNPTGAPIPWLQYTESRPVGLAPQPLSGIVDVAAGETAEVRYTLPTYRRGRHQIGPLRWSAGDPFGLFRMQGRLEALTAVTVYPRITPLPELGLPARLPMGDLASRRSLFEDPAWLSGTRPYAPGDSMKRIHWAATARSGELVSRQYRHAVLLPACVCLNLNRAEYDPRLFAGQVELAVGAAASLCHHLAERRQQVALLTNGVDPEWEGPDKGTAPATTDCPRVPCAEAPGQSGQLGVVFLPLRQGQQAMPEILEVLARIEGGSSLPFAATVAEYARRLPWGTLLCLVTHQETAEVADLCARLGREGKQVLLFVLSGVSGHRDGYQVWLLTENRAAEVVVG